MIIELEAIKQELRVNIDDDDERIMGTINQAIALILGYLKVQADEYHDVTGENDFPDLVYAAIVRAVMAMYDEPDKDPLTPAVRSMLHRLRDPAMS